MKAKVKKLWEDLNGMKTAIGLTLHAIWLIVGLAANIDFKTRLEVHGYIATITGTGVIHKIVKYFKK